MEIAELEVVNIVYKGKIKNNGPLKFKDIYLRDYEKWHVIYNPDEFPGIRFQAKDKSSKIKAILLFSSGAFVITARGELTKEEILRELREIIQSS